MVAWFLFWEIWFLRQATNFFRQKNWEELCGRALLEKLDEASITLINLEAPVTSRRNRHYKCGWPNLKSTPAAHLLKCLPFVVISGTNNHILDFGSEGLDGTLKILETNKIPYIWNGEKYCGCTSITINWNWEKPDWNLFLYTIRILNCWWKFSWCKSIWSSLFDDISALKAQCDFCIILYHSERKNYEYTSVNQQKMSKDD